MSTRLHNLRLPRLFSILGTLFLLLTFPAHPLNGHESTVSKGFFPLVPGTYWVYEGTVQWSTADPEKPDAEPALQSAKVTLRMTVERVIEKPDYKIALLSGFPYDLNFATSEVEAKPWLLIETKNHEMILDALSPDFDMKRIETGEFAPDKRLSEDNLLFRWPLKKDQKFCSPEFADRPDGMYCWLVTSQKETDLSKIAGSPFHQVDAFLLQNRTNPDITELLVAPGLGIIHYEYHHHGTIADTVLSLTEFHLGGMTQANPGVPQ